MKIVIVSGSIIGSKTKTAMLELEKIIKETSPEHVVTTLDLAEYELQFSDGRNYMEYDGDTKYVAETVMEADAIIFGTPIFQASIPATLKNIFDLLPEIGRAHV